MPRLRLWEQLERATANAVTLLVAPVGAGKTLGVSGWLHYSPSTQADGARWLQADSSWTPDRLAEVLDEIPESTDPGPEGAPAPGAGPRLVVVDDAHALPSASLRMLDERLNTAPDGLRVLLISRWDLPLTRLASELLGNLSVLRGDLLRMGDAECAALITEHARTTDPEVVRAIIAQAQGWCAAVVLTARAAGVESDPMAVVRRYASGNATVADRVASDVLAALSTRQRHVLLCVGAEGTVTGAVAAHLANDAGAADVLAELETTGLLVTRMPPATGHSGDGPAADDDSGGTRYRIHPLLVEVIRRRLAAGGVDVSQARSTVTRAVHLDIAAGRSAGAFSRLVGMNAVDAAADVLATDGVRVILGEGCGPEVAEFVHTHPDLIESRPDTWFAVAVDRWVVNDVERARHWADRIVEHERHHTPGTRPDARFGEPVSDYVAGAPGDVLARVACVRLWRARLGLEPIYAAVGLAKRVVTASQTRPLVQNAHAADLPVLVNELGITQNWLGELADAEASLTFAIGLSRTQGLSALAAAAMSHLAFTEYMAGREHTCVEVATEALSMLGAPEVRRMPFAPSRAGLALLLGGLVDVPWPAEPIVAPSTGTGSRVQDADLCMLFWLRMRDSRLALMSGAVAAAEQALSTPLPQPQLAETELPDHLRVALLLEHAFLAALSSDRSRLETLEGRLEALGAGGEAELVAGLRADLVGDRRAAAAAFDAAAGDVLYSQPASRALALTCAAQLLDALGEPEAALDRLAEAATVTEVRRNAVPFLGWSRQGTPIETLLRRLLEQRATPWVRELAAAADGRPDVTTVYAATTATPIERDAGAEMAVLPVLSPREREVLGELARGATYADIAAALFVSENTVKTHVSSLYSKLGVSRRSKALAVARGLHLL